MRAACPRWTMCSSTCVWDEIPERGQAWAKELGTAFEPDLDKLLARDDVDAVCIDTPTNMHKDSMIKAAKAGKHIYTEKVMCLNVKDCDEVIKAVEENHVVFTISLPQRAWPKFLFIKQAIESGVMGDVTVLRCRNCHDGALAGWLPDYWYDPETTGGGAMMDLGAHPMYLSAWMLGNPVRIQSMFTNKTGHAVEDKLHLHHRVQRAARSLCPKPRSFPPCARRSSKFTAPRA